MPYLSTGGLTIVVALVSVPESSLSSAVAIGLSIACITAIIGALMSERSTSLVKYAKRNR
jgi:hypothetical protein